MLVMQLLSDKRQKKTEQYIYSPLVKILLSMITGEINFDLTPTFNKFSVSFRLKQPKTIKQGKNNARTSSFWRRLCPALLTLRSVY